MQKKNNISYDDGKALKFPINVLCTHPMGTVSRWKKSIQIQLRPSHFYSRMPKVVLSFCDLVPAMSGSEQRHSNVLPEQLVMV